MTNIIVSPSSAHWYDKNGRPRHTLPNKSRPGELRNTTVRDARELELYPSVSAMLGMIRKPALDSWIATQYVLSALTLPQYPEESQDDFARRVVRDASTEGQRAADFGTNVHQLAEDYLRGTIRDVLTPVELNFLAGFMDWATKHRLEPLEIAGHKALEVSFTNLPGCYAGTFDFLGVASRSEDVGCQCGCAVWAGFGTEPVLILADYKTQSTKYDKSGAVLPVNFYPEWGPQLAAYEQGAKSFTGDTKVLKLSIVISSTVPGLIKTQAWDDFNDNWCWESFKSLRQLYYSPLGQGHSLPWRPVDD